MGTSLEQPRKATLPVVRHTAIGQTLVGIIVNAEQRDQQRKTLTGWEPILKPDGRPRREEIITYMVVNGTAQVGVRDSEETRIVETGELVRYIYRGLKWSQRIDAYNTLGDFGGMQVGDRHGIKVTGAVAVNDQGVIPNTECTTDEQVVQQRIKGRNITWNIELQIRRAKDDEAASCIQAEEHHTALTTVVVEMPTPTTFDPFAGGEEPF